MISGVGKRSCDVSRTCCSSESDTGQLAAGTCEIVTLDRDSSQPRRTIARQTARCACRKGQIAGTTRARPACVDDSSSDRCFLTSAMISCGQDEGHTIPHHHIKQDVMKIAFSPHQQKNFILSTEKV
ncbi:uncharacterized protein LOC119023686 isoform X3 [Acanthopagrus latus]|uniref:uncharacterized protein LOC119023686 isoform X3 n=1 Tax=Acanthopagrus latus TaxID=8177 RepID=UPI00187BF072|nr:uncharacterized protein LOC119023686 isoform X3 [Acanthopagrus latus]